VLYGWGTAIHFIPETGLYYFIGVGASGSPTSTLATCGLHQRFAPGSMPLLPTVPEPVTLTTTGDTFWQCRNTFTGPLVLGQIFKRASSNDYIVPTTTSDFLLLNLKGTPIPYNLLSNQTYQYNTSFDTRNDTDLEFCSFVSVSAVAFNTPEYFTFAGPTVGYARIRDINLSTSYALGVLFTAVVGVVVTTLALFIALLVRRVRNKKDGYTRDDLNDDSSAGKYTLQDNDDSSEGKFAKVSIAISFIVYITALIDVLFMVLFFIVYATTAPRIDRLSVVEGSAWQFVLVCPKVLCFLVALFGVEVISLLAMRPQLWLLQKERYVFSVFHFAFMLMLVLGFANVGNL